MDEERDPGPGVHSDEINPDCPFGLLCHKCSLGCTQFEVPAGHPGPIDVEWVVAAAGLRQKREHQAGDGVFLNSGQLAGDC